MCIEQLISDDGNEIGKLRHNAIDMDKHDEEIEIEGNLIPNVKEEHIIHDGKQNIGKEHTEECNDTNTDSTLNADNRCEACDTIKLHGRPLGIKKCVHCGKDWMMYKRIGM